MDNKILKALNSEIDPQKVAELCDWSSTTINLANVLKDSGIMILAMLGGPSWQITASGLTLFGLLLKHLGNNNKELSLQESAAVVLIEAYLRGIHELSKNNKIQEKISAISNEENKDHLTKAFSQCEQEIIQCLSLQDSLDALSEFSGSLFSKTISCSIHKLLTTCGMEEDEIDLFLKRAEYYTPLYFYEVINKNPVKLQSLTTYLTESGQGGFNRVRSIENYLTKEIATLPEEELKKLYVPLKANDKDLAEQIRDILIKERDPDKVILINAGPGRGKTSFTKIFSDEIRKDIYPFFLSTGQKMQKRVAKITGKGFDRKLLDIKQTLRYNEPT